MRHTIEIKNEEDATFIKELLTKLHIEILKEEEVMVHASNKTAEIIGLFKELSERNTYAAEIEYPVAWQREIREDRKLPFRED